MKATFKTLATLVVASALAFAGCTKEKIQPIVPDTPEEEPVENLFVGTSWTAHLENTYYNLEQGMSIQMDITYDLSLDFLDSTNAELFHDLYVYVPVYPSASQSQNMTETFTYSFSKDSVFLHGTYINDESGDTIDYFYTLVYDKEANTLTLDFDDSDMEEMMGTSVVVFTKSEDAAKAIIPASSSSKGKVNWHKLVGKIARALNN